MCKCCVTYLLVLNSTIWHMTMTAGQRDDGSECTVEVDSGSPAISGGSSGGHSRAFALPLSASALPGCPTMVKTKTY